MTQERQKIVDDALLEMRKARGKLNPKFLEKIRNLVKSSPALIEKLGLKKTEIPLAVIPPTKIENVVVEKKAPVEDKGYEKIDQSKNIDVISKLMEISPEKKDKIVEMLSKKQ